MSLYSIVKASSILAVIAMLLLPPLIKAQTAQPAAPRQDISAGELVCILYKIARWVFTILIVVTIIFGLMAAYQYITAIGDAEKLLLAKMNTLWAMVALAIGILAFSIPRIVSDIVGGPNVVQCTTQAIYPIPTSGQYPF